MRAIILAESSELDLSPLTDHCPHPLLPLAGKSILMHALEALHHSSIRDIEVVAPSLHEKLREETDIRPLLGMQVRFGPQMFDPRHSNEQCLIIGLQTLIDIDWKEVFNQFSDTPYQSRVAVRMMTMGETFALLIPANFDGRISCDWSDIYHTEAVQAPIPEAVLIRTQSISDYYDANINMVNRAYQHLAPAGREITIGHHASPKARVHANSLRSRNGYFGSNSKVDKTASLFGSVVLGNNVVVDKGARITNSIIFDSTYIGANTDCSEAIINGNMMIKARTGLCLKLDDPLLFGAIA